MIRTSSASDFISEAERLIHWCRNDALPLWGRTGVDEDGSFHECLSGEGEPDRSANRRTRVQCRQIYVFAQAYELGWLAASQPICDTASERLLDRALCIDAGGRIDGIVNALAPDGSISDPTRDLYTHAFFLFSLAWRQRAFRDDQAIDLADATIDYLDRKLKAENGGWIEGLPPATPRRQNPHMHLFEAFLALYQATGQDRFLKRAEDMAALFGRHFFDPSTGNLLEFFHEDWSPDAEDGRIVEPGHLMEWCWLLNLYGALSGSDMSSASRKLYDRAIEYGRDRASGLLIDRIDASGAPIWKRRRLWPQTEFIKAAIVMAEAGDPNALGVAAKVIGETMRTYLNTPVSGGWRDRYEEDGAVIPGPMPASSFYHLMMAVAEAHRMVGVLTAPRQARAGQAS